MTTQPTKQPATQAELDANVEKIFSNVISVYHNMQLKDVLGCTVKIMECAELIPSFVGADKKKVVKGVINLIVDQIPFPDPREKTVVVFLVNSGLIDLIIDAIVKLTKEGCRINIQEVMKKACCKCKKTAK